MALGALLLHAVLASGSPCVRAAGKARFMRPLRSDACALAARSACQPARSCLGSESRRERGALEGGHVAALLCCASFVQRGGY